MSKSPSLRRIQADVRELALDPSDRYYAAPLENDMFEWHFTIRGADGTDFEGGIYHGRILLPPEYPFKPPHIMFLTPSGRFEINTKVCLSFSAYHPELWQPAWGIRLILEALISFLPTPADGAIGALDWSSKERKRLAIKSNSLFCNLCGKCSDLLPKLDPEKKKMNTPKFSKEIEQLQRLQQLTGGNKNAGDEEERTDTVEQKNDNAASVEEESSQKQESSLNEIINTHEPEEEEIVFEPMTDDPSSPPSPASNNPATEAPRQQSAQDAVQTQPQQQGGEDVAAAVADAPAASDPSWMYDPLLNLIIVLLAAICYMLWQKFEALKEELADLRAENLLLE